MYEQKINDYSSKENITKQEISNLQRKNEGLKNLEKNELIKLTFSFQSLFS